MGEYKTKDSGARDEFQTGARRDLGSGKGRYALLSPVAIERLAKLLERGAKKYGPRNWEKGMPFSRTMESLLRHAFQYLAGDREEDHLAAVMFNAMALAHYEEMIEKGKLPSTLDDLPYPPPSVSVGMPVSKKQANGAFQSPPPNKPTKEPKNEQEKRFERMKAFLLHTSEGQDFCALGMCDLAAEKFGVSIVEAGKALDEIGAECIGSCSDCLGPVARIPVQGKKTK